MTNDDEEIEKKITSAECLTRSQRSALAVRCGTTQFQGKCAVKDFSNQHGERLEAHLLCEESKMGWTTVCIKTKKKKQKTANFIIKTEKNPFFFLIVNLSINVPHVVV